MLSVCYIAFQRLLQPVGLVFRSRSSRSLRLSCPATSWLCCAGRSILFLRLQAELSRRTFCTFLRELSSPRRTLPIVLRGVERHEGTVRNLIHVHADSPPAAPLRPSCRVQKPDHTARGALVNHTCPSRIRPQSAIGSWTKSRRWETQRTVPARHGRPCVRRRSQRRVLHASPRTSAFGSPTTRRPLPTPRGAAPGTLHVTIELPDERRAVDFERYLKSGSVAHSRSGTSGDVSGRPAALHHAPSPRLHDR